MGCGCRDPWVCKCRRSPVESENQIDGWVAAIKHLLSADLLPLVPTDVLRQIWRRGGDYRSLAASVADVIGRRG